MNSGSKLLVDSTYGSLAHKLNPVYGVGADIVKGVAIDNKDFIKSISDSTRTSTVSSFIEGGIGTSNASKFISSFGGKYIEYKKRAIKRGK